MAYFKNSEITIEVTNNSSATCIMCPREKQSRELESMAAMDWEKIIFF